MNCLNKEILIRAMLEFNTREFIGSKHNPKILEYFKKVGHSWVKDDETAWCAAFVGFVLEECGIASTKKLNAKSYLNWGISIANPGLGDIVILWRITPNSPYGHVGFFVASDQNSVYVLSGNQQNMVNIEAYPLSRVLGYRHIV